MSTDGQAAYTTQVLLDAAASYKTAYDAQLVTSPYVMSPCPAGKYNKFTGKPTADWCVNCEPTFACMEIGMGDPADAYVASTTRNEREDLTGRGTFPLCAAGFYCTSGSPSTHPYEELSGYYGPCPAGSYCGIGEETP